MITKNIATCIKGLRLLGDGKAQEARDLMKDCTAHDLREAITILEDQALWAGKPDATTIGPHAIAASGKAS
jgi:hypothetical protein